MTYDTYLRILQDRLEESGVDPLTLSKTLERERATLSGIAHADVSKMFNEERLSVIVASAVRKSVSNSTDNTTVSMNTFSDEFDTLASHNSSCESTVRVGLTASDDGIVVSADLEKTVVCACPSLPKILLESDTATVNISQPDPLCESRFVSETDTGLTPSVPGEVFHKLLSESATVHISDKDTANFFITDTETLVLAPSVDDIEVTVSFPTPVSDDGNLSPFIEESHQQKKKQKVIPVKTEDSQVISEQDLKNPHPKTLLALLLIILFPYLLAFGGVWASIFFIGALFLSVFVCFPIFFYVVTVSFSCGGVLYGLYCAVSFFWNWNFTSGLKGCAIVFVAVLVLTLSFLFLHRLVIPVYRYFFTKLRAFLRLNLFVFRYVRRNLIKNTKNI